ncbi:acyl-CoA thioesterase [bacterium]|nr:acyl-CoA thioesterase [bacterium]
MVQEGLSQKRFAVFITEIPVQPRDIDMNGHVHHSVYLDYFLAARFDQMGRCYKMSMDEFNKLGFTMFARKYEIEYRGALAMGDVGVVKTWVIKIGKASVDVGFQIESRKDKTLAVKGAARFVMIDIRIKKPVPIPQNVKEKYSILAKEEDEK